MCTSPKLIAPFHKARLLEVEVAMIQFKKMTLVRTVEKQLKEKFQRGREHHAPGFPCCMYVGARILTQSSVFFRTERPAVE
jgi:hypothetical protein